MEKIKKKWLIGISTIAVMLIVFVSAVFVIIESKKNVTVDILVAPISAEININGKIYENGTYKFEPGVIEVIISKDGFKTEEKTIDLQKDDHVKIYTYLVPLDGSFDWYLNSEEDMMILNAIGDAEANASSADYSSKYPIIDVLPIIYADYDDEWNYTEFRIDGGSFEDCDIDFCLKITDTTGGNLEYALDLIKENGFDPDNYEILYEYSPIAPLN